MRWVVPGRVRRAVSARRAAWRPGCSTTATVTAAAAAHSVVTAATRAVGLVPCAPGALCPYCPKQRHWAPLAATPCLPPPRPHPSARRAASRACAQTWLCAPRARPGRTWGAAGRSRPARSAPAATRPAPAPARGWGGAGGRAARAARGPGSEGELEGSGAPRCTSDLRHAVRWQPSRPPNHDTPPPQRPAPGPRLPLPEARQLPLVARAPRQDAALLGEVVLRLLRRPARGRLQREPRAAGVLAVCGGVEGAALHACVGGGEGMGGWEGLPGPPRCPAA